MQTIATAMIINIDTGVIELSMDELVRDESAPSAFIIYLFLYCAARNSGGNVAKETSYNAIAKGTGLSRSAAQSAIRLLNDRKYIKSKKKGDTGTYDHRILKY